MVKSMAEIFRAHAVLDDQGRHIGGTDKQSNHRYGDAYESLFPDRSAARYVMEVGIADGSSMLAWREIFQGAHIVGMDIEPCSCRRGPRLEFWVGNQRDRGDCIRAATNNGAEPGRRFDLIVEDAYHSADNTILTLLYLWPFVKRGGLYVVEEWYDINVVKNDVLELFPMARILLAVGPSGGIEPLVVFQKPE